MNSRPPRGEAATLVIVILGAVALLGYMFKPRVLDGESRRADQSKEASAQVEAAVAVAVETERAKGAAAAAIVTEIGAANAEAPPSPSRDFIAREVPLALSYLPKADLIVLLAAQERRAAIAEGRADLVEKLYKTAYADAQLTMARAVAAETKLEQSFASRRQADAAISEAAAVNLALTRQRNQLIVGVVVLVVLMIVARIYLVSPGTLGKMAADMRAGVSPITALDTHLSPLLHSRVKRAAKLHAED